MRVTLDTNVFGPVADISAYPVCPDSTACSALRQLIKSGHISAFISEGSLSLEALSHEQRIDEFFREWASKTSGIVLPTPHPQRLQIVEEVLNNLGVKVLHVPNIALRAFVEVAPTSWANDDVFSVTDRLQRHSCFIRSFPGKGQVTLQRLGASLVLEHQLNTSSIPRIPNWPPPEEFLWLRGIVAELDNPKKFSNRAAFIRDVSNLISEWCDLDILASHYAYGNDYFCTFDEAKTAGPTAILHPANRLHLEQQFGLKILSPKELVTLV